MVLLVVDHLVVEQGLILVEPVPLHLFKVSMVVMAMETTVLVVVVVLVKQETLTVNRRVAMV